MIIMHQIRHKNKTFGLTFFNANMSFNLSVWGGNQLYSIQTMSEFDPIGVTFCQAKPSQDSAIAQQTGFS